MSIKIQDVEYLTVGDLKKILDNLEGKDHMHVVIGIGDDAALLTAVHTKVHEPVWLSRIRDRSTLAPLAISILGAERTVVLRGEALR